MDVVVAVGAWFLDPAHWTGADAIPVRLFEHLALSGTAVLVGAAIGLPVGLAIGHSGRGSGVAIAVAGLGRAVPSYALLIFFVPLVGLGFAAAFPALVLLAIPPILVNTHAALRGVDREAIEAGRAMGMTEPGLLRDVEIPLALPSIVAGLRTASVQVVATATLAALVAGGGLGRYIVDGLGLQQPDRLLAGAILVGLVALLVERGFSLVQRRLAGRGEWASPTSPPDPLAIPA
jgi:osmoprotectant transport system permease protein